MIFFGSLIQIAIKDGHPVKGDTFANSREVKLFKFSG